MAPLLTVARVALAATSTSSASGPLVDLPPEPDAAPAPAPKAQPEPDLTRGLRDYRFAIAASTSLGGYTEIAYTKRFIDSAEDVPALLDLRRVVLFIAHNFTDELRFYAELEIEHALAGQDLPGYAAFEQAFLDYRLLDDLLSLRVGLVLVPMGFINQWHEPTVFHGVDRPAVERNIIPSTWREVGAGVFGTLAEGLDYELYLLAGLDPLGFDATRVVAGGRKQGALSPADGLAIAGRLEYEPILGAVFGVSGYFCHAGPNAGRLFGSAGGPELDLTVPVFAVAVDARGRYRGFEARAVGAAFSIGDTNALRSATDAAGNFIGPDVAQLAYGAYLELAYDLLLALETEHQLLPFARVEHYDTMAKLDGRDKTVADASRAITDFVFGLSYRPITQVVFKGDVVLRRPGGEAPNETLTNIGLGLVF